MSISPSVFMLQSSFTGGPRAAFEGYCFVGSDYIFGPEGAALYTAETGRPVSPGEDGCYVAAAPSPEGLEFGCDAAGTAKLFWYDKGDVWGVSTSLSRLVDHLRAHGVRLTPNLPQLQALSWGITFTKQVNSFATIFNEVRLLPSDRRLVLTPAGLREKASDAASCVPYPEALRSFIDIWRARFATLFTDDRIQVTLDLTGGVDSRAIFALAKGALAMADAPATRAIFRSSTTPRWKKDLEVATRLASTYGVVVNPPEGGATRHLSARESFVRWRDVCLGVYLPIYLHDSVTEPFRIHINGGGGENHRHFYPAVSSKQFLDTQRRHAPAHLYCQWRADTEDALSYLVNQNPSVEPLILHYREFRNRFHTGRPPLYRTGFGPLTTTLFHRSAMRGGITHAGQLNFDIMENLLPGLMDFPYDDPSKAPTNANRENLTLLDPGPAQPIGRTYIGVDNSSRSERHPNRLEDAERPMDLVAQECTEALRNPAVQSFAGEHALTQAHTLLDTASANGRFEHATMAKGISFLLAAGLAFGT